MVAHAAGKSFLAAALTSFSLAAIGQSFSNTRKKKNSKFESRNSKQIPNPKLEIRNKPGLDERKLVPPEGMVPHASFLASCFLN
jgi:hypothetical protein